jgi:hypothetical protein
MARAVVILSADRVGDAVTVSGTVDGQPATVQLWASHLATMPDNLTRRQYAAQQLVNALPQSVPVQITGNTMV